MLGSGNSSVVVEKFSSIPFYEHAINKFNSEILINIMKKVCVEQSAKKILTKM